MINQESNKGILIEGQWQSGTGKLEVFNPANGELLSTVETASPEQVDQAIESAYRAQETWSKTTTYQRAEILSKAHKLMLERRAELAELMTKEQGKPLKAANNEVGYAADFLRWYAEEAKRNYGHTIPSARSDQRFIVQYEPVGVVAAITPWNYPISMITRKVAPALAAGCTVVLKPAEATPLCAIAVYDILLEAGVPEGVINMVCTNDPAPIGKVFCSHPLVRKITFTGSTAVGKKLATDAAPHLKRMSMELGGHAPFIVFDDADPVHAAKGAGLVKFLNTGQACISPNRMFVQRGIYEEFVDTLASRVAKLKPGNGLDPSVSIGPLVNEAAVKKVANQVKDAVGKGASVAEGGEILAEGEFAKGHFHAPTVLRDITEDMLIYREETFGPVAAVMPFDEFDEVIQRANDTHYGLAAYVYTQNLSKAFRTYEALNFGIIGVNDINPTSAAAPFGGMKESGLGREGAREGLMEYLECKSGGFSI